MPSREYTLRALRPIAGACLLSLATTLAAAEPARYELDPVHTRVMFAVEHAGFSHAIGTVSGTTGVLEFDPDDWRTVRLQASVPLAQIDLGDADWNRAALAGNLLDVEDYPVATFVSTRIEPASAKGDTDAGAGDGDDADASASAGASANDDDDTAAADASANAATDADTNTKPAADETIAQAARVCGDLTLHGVTREVCLDVTMNALKRHPLPPFRRTAGFSATTQISRKDFGIDAWSSVIGDTIELRIEAEATRSGRANVLDALDENAPPPEALHVPPDAPGAEPIPVPQPAPDPDPQPDPQPQPAPESKPEPAETP